MSQPKTDSEFLTRRSFLKGAVLVSAGGATLLKTGVRGVLAQTTTAAEGSKPILYLVATAHNDTQWNWTVQDTLREWIPNTFRPNWELMRKYPDYKFNYEATIHYGWFKEYHPEDWKELQDWVAKGRWKLSGAWVNAVDVVVPSAESLFRQALYGQAFFRREFGQVPRDIYLPDCFGFPYSLPTIARHSGLTAFSSQKFDLWGGWRPAPFSVGRWEGVDGSQVVAALRPKAYNARLTTDVARDPKWATDFTDAGGQPVNMRYFGTGDKGGTPGDESVSWAQKSIEDKDGIARVVNTSADQLAKDLTPAQIAALPVYKGELIMTNHGSGCYSSQATMKKWNRANETLADAAERAALASQWLGGTAYPHQVLNEAWLRVLWHQFHDDLTGTCIPQAYTFSWNDELLSLGQFAAVLTTSVSGIARSLDTRAQGVPLAIYNSLDRTRRDCVEATVTLPSDAPDIRVFDTASGREVPSQMLSKNGRQVRIVFLAEVPSVGVQIYDVRPSQIPCDLPSQLVATLAATETTLENGRLRIRLNPDGDLASIFDKSANLELLGAAATLQHFHDVSRGWPAWEVLWDVIGKPPLGDMKGNVHLDLVERGPVRITVEVERTLGETIWKQRLSLTEGGDWLQLDNEVDWRSPGTLIKAAFPLSVSNPIATFDMGLGTIERPNSEPKRHEVPAQSWADLSDPNGRGGLAILTSTKYGFDKTNDTTLRLTLLRTPESGRNYPHQETNDIGHHRFSYALAPHAGDWRQGNVQTRAARFNHPLLAFQTVPHSGNERKFSLLGISTPQVAIRAIKQAEDSTEWVIRLHELHGQAAQKVRVKFGARVQSVREINAAEEVVGAYKVTDGDLVVDFKPYQPRTFALRLAGTPRKIAAPRSRVVLLPFNLNGISTHSNLGVNNFDGRGQTFAGELWPSQLERDGVRFELGKVGAPNFVECRGQTITLPKGDFSRVVLLATAINGDQRGDFRVQTGSNVATSHPLRIADWAQHIGQWDSRLSNPSQGNGGGQVVKDIAEGRVQRIDKLKPAYLKRDRVAWVGTHRHTPQGDALYLFSYLFQYEINVPKGATRLLLPNNPNIRIAAASLAQNTLSDTRAAGALIEPHLTDATIPVIPPRPPANTRVFGPTGLQTFDGKNEWSQDSLLTLPTGETESWTINMFVWVDTAPDNHTLVGGFGDGHDQTGAERYLGRVNGGIQFWGSSIDIDSGVPFDIGRWQMLSVTFDGKTITIYKNGESIKSAPAQLSEASPEVHLAPMDTWGNRQHPFAGRVQGFSIWNAALSPVAIRALMNAIPKG
ncbi:mannosylglycerate hydrolase [Abditibacteriota bacterium]|nr:mannosylglycerate hydrolase [Abditibacteriota bacterium]